MPKIGSETLKYFLIKFKQLLDNDSKIQDVIYLNPEQIPEQKSERKAVFTLI